jgi:plasmid stabilization system protein ParE
MESKFASKPFRFHPEAREDFRDAIRWYRARSTIASVEFRTSVSGAIRNLAHTPELWPKYLHGTRRFVLHRFPFSVIYLDDHDVVTIIAVAHSKRKPGYWKHRVGGPAESIR